MYTPGYGTPSIDNYGFGNANGNTNKVNGRGFTPTNMIDEPLFGERYMNGRNFYGQFDDRRENKYMDMWRLEDFADCTPREVAYTIIGTEMVSLFRPLVCELSS